MRIGTTLPHMGELARPDVVVAAAQRAEALGYDTVWVADRLLYPLQWSLSTLDHRTGSHEDSRTMMWLLIARAAS